MSLINQVLKDLEQRHAEQLVEATHSLDGLSFAPQVATNQPARHRRWLLLLLALAVLVVVMAGVFWYWQQQQTARVQTPAPTMQLPAQTEPPAPSPAEPVVAVQPEPAPAPIAAATITKEVTTAPVSVTPEPVPTVKRKTPVAAAPPTQSASENTDAGRTTIAKQMVPMSSEQKAELFYQSGYKSIQEHQHRSAEQALRDALRIEAGHLKARELLAGLLIKQGRWIEASEILQRGIEIAAHHRSFVTLQARTLMQLNRDQQAITLLRDFAPSMHEDPEHFALLAALYQRQGDHHAAANTYGQLLKLRPGAGIWWVGLGISLESLGRHPEARDAYLRAQQSGSLHADIARYTDNRLLALDAIHYPE